MRASILVKSSRVPSGSCSKTVSSTFSLVTAGRSICSPAEVIVERRLRRSPGSLDRSVMPAVSSRESTSDTLGFIDAEDAAKPIDLGRASGGIPVISPQ